MIELTEETLKTSHSSTVRQAQHSRVIALSELHLGRYRSYHYELKHLCNKSDVNLVPCLYRCFKMTDADSGWLAQVVLLKQNKVGIT